LDWKAVAMIVSPNLRCEQHEYVKMLSKLSWPADSVQLLANALATFVPNIFDRLAPLGLIPGADPVRVVLRRSYFINIF
jgi:hypothetical protein